ncbi:uncharacterized protein DEA37_0014753 [Paragonimus westermani]|uniref:Hormone-sensitive lipase N-terminal domain-containing protein n=1 Tax=Paragonimus westermani TaxID=34504 RepID=A0A5J4NLH4_9TREM|nr:uncharacterized protein DEA37_0014753 [Paragonimus westermani]
MLHRFTAAQEANIRKEQTVFYSGRRWVDHIFTVRQILEQRHKYRRPTRAVFLGYKGAFDSVDRPTLSQSLERRTVPIKYVNIPSALYSQCAAQLTRVSESQVCEEQAGFRSGRGCIDHTFTLRRILEHRHCYRQPTVVILLDLKAAFDSVARNVLWNCLLCKGVPGKYVNLLKSLAKLTDLEYVDDIVLSSPFAENMQTVPNRESKQGISNLVYTVCRSVSSLLSPEARGLILANLTRNANVEFCKAFWSLAEHPIVSGSPNIILPTMALVHEFELLPRLLRVPLRTPMHTSTTSTVDEPDTEDSSKWLASCI